MKVNMQGLIIRLDSLRGRLNELFENLDSLEELEQQDIEIENVQQYFQADDTFNLAIATDILEQVDKLDKAFEIIKKKSVCIVWLKNGLSAYNSTAALYELPRLTQEEYDLLKEVL